MRLRDVPVPGSTAARGALEVTRAFSSTALTNHCLRAYLLAAAYGLGQEMHFDAELLYVAAMVHDIGLTEAFDNHRRPFETAGGDLAWAFTAGAGWSIERRDRARVAVIDHMLDTVDPRTDPEGHLLMIATSFDISGRRAEAWPSELLDEIVTAYPRGGLRHEFVACFVDQAARKPDTEAAVAVASGLARRMTAHPQEQKPSGGQPEEATRRDRARP